MATPLEYLAQLQKDVQEQNDLFAKQKQTITDLNSKLMAETTNKTLEVQQLPAVQPASSGFSKYIIIAAILFIAVMWLIKRRKK